MYIVVSLDLSAVRRSRILQYLKFSTLSASTPVRRGTMMSEAQMMMLVWVTLMMVTSPG